MIAPDMLTICICTHNRAETLRETIASLVQLSEIDNVRIDVVANNCSDHTPEVVKSFQRELPRISLVIEPQPGISAARNAGLDSVETEYIAYIDDDVIVDRNWLNNLLKALYNSGADLVTGKVLPYWKSGKPWWVNEAFLPLLSLVDRGDGTVKLEDTFVPGANMVWRSDILKKIGGFSSKFGPKSGGVSASNLMGEEAEAVARLLADGGLAVYDGGIIVHHLTTPDRCSLKGMYLRAISSGKTRAALKLADKVEVEDELAWAVGCIISSLAALRLKSALFFYFRAVNCIYTIREYKSLGIAKHGAFIGLLAGSKRLRKGLLGLAKRTMLGRPAVASKD